MGSAVASDGLVIVTTRFSGRKREVRTAEIGTVKDNDLVVV